MFLAYIIYSFIMAIMFLFYKKEGKYMHIIPVILITFLLGNRYNVGIDFPTYKFDYEHNNVEKYEIIYRIISEFLWTNGFSFYVLLSCTVMVYYLFYYASFKEIRYIFPYCILFFMAFGPFTFLLNGIRQAISFSIFLYSIQYIWKNNFYKYSLLIVIATGIHSFSLILLPLFLLRYVNFDKLKVIHLLVAYILTLIIGDSLFERIIAISIDELKSIGYGVYINSLGDNKMTYGTGIGMAIMQSIDIVMLLYFNKMKSEFLNTPFSIYFGIYFIGLLSYNVVGLDLLGNRAIYCFISVRFIVAGFMLYYLIKNYFTSPVHKIITCYLFFSSILLYIANVNGSQNGCSPFYFNFLSDAHFILF